MLNFGPSHPPFRQGCSHYRPWTEVACPILGALQPDLLGEQPGRPTRRPRPPRLERRQRTSRDTRACSLQLQLA
eukprot:4135535-Amphidinium_carterae.2